MKTSNLKNKFFPLLALLIGMTNLVACNNGGGGGSASTPNTPAYIAQCPGCQGQGLGGGDPLLRQVQSQTATNSIFFQLDIIGQGNQMSYATCMQPPEKRIVCYQGPATLVGYLAITQHGDPLLCGAPAGDYQVRPLQVSRLMMGAMQGGAFEAIGPQGSRIVFRLASATFYNKDGGGLNSYSQNNRAGLNIVIDSVNGFPCGSLSTY